MKKFLALFVVVMLLVAAGSAFAADSGHGGSTTPSNPYSGNGNSNSNNGTDTPGTDTPGTDTPGTDTPGTDTPAGVAVVPVAPTLNLSNPAVVQAILATLGGRFANAPVEALSLAGLAPRSPSDVPAATRDSITRSGRRIGLVLPVLVITSTGVKVFGLDMSALTVGNLLFLMLNPRAAAVSFFAADDDTDAAPTTAAPEEKDYSFLDADGNELTTVPPAGTTVNVAAYMEAGNTYEPIVTVADAETPGTDTPGTDTPGTDTPGTDTPGTDTPGTDTPGTDTPGTDTPGTDTPGTDTPGTNTEPDNDVGSSGGGCDAGFGALALAALAGFVARKR